MSEPERPNTKRECYGCEKLTERVENLQDENKRLRETLAESADYIAAHPAERIITTGERIVSEARKLLNL